jgi:rod shape-determining protein MreC
MLSKRVTLLLVCLILFWAACLIWFSGIAKRRLRSVGVEHIGITLIAPFQQASTTICRTAKNAWRHYFFLVHAAMENDSLKKQLGAARNRIDQCRETELALERLRKLLDFKAARGEKIATAEVVARDPSPWFKSLIINKGSKDGIRKGFPVVVPEGIVGQIVEVSDFYAKVLLLIDRNSAADGLVQRTRARGIVKGSSAEHCFFDYVLRKSDVRPGDRVISSGLDGVYPKGLNIGKVTDVSPGHEASIFQNVGVKPDVNFEKIEEVLVILQIRKNPFDD